MGGWSHGAGVWCAGVLVWCVQSEESSKTAATDGAKARRQETQERGQVVFGGKKDGRAVVTGGRQGRQGRQGPRFRLMDG